MDTTAGVPTPDENTLARALLTQCIDSADALMFATMKGCEDAGRIVELLLSIHSGGAGRDTMETYFAQGLTRWGRHVNAQSLQAFRRALVRWLTRLDGLPTSSPTGLLDRFTHGGSLWIIAPHSRWWPHQLDDLSIRKDWAPPLCLWGRGSIDALTSCSHPIAIVGSRGADDYGKGIARSLAQSAARSGHLVVSGGAMGTDAAAHWGALDAKRDDFDDAGHGRTAAVFAGGLDHIGPHANDNLFARILEHDGVLLSELSPDAIPEPRRFLLRNRIIAAIASSVVVAQARRRSGALNTANWAADLGREVYAAPGAITTPRNAGCNALIRDNKAVILCSVHDIDTICHEAHARATDPCMGDESSGSNETMILRAIRRCKAHHQKATVDVILDALRQTQPPTSSQPMTPQLLTQSLGMMELHGSIRFDQGIIDTA